MPTERLLLFRLQGGVRAAQGLRVARQKVSQMPRM